MTQRITYLLLLYLSLTSLSFGQQDLYVSAFTSSSNILLEKTPNSILATFNTYDKYAWFDIPLNPKEWGNLVPKNINASIANRSDQKLEVLFWVVGKKSWYAVSDIKIIQPKSLENFTCNLKEEFPDGTFKLLPNTIKGIRVMVKKPHKGSQLEISKIKLSKKIKPWHAHEGRIEIPEIKEGLPSSGNRVKYYLQDNTNQYSVVYLPKNWDKNKKHPIIIEFPGNIFYTKNCFSTGKPDQCQIGYGMSKGENAIWISMPFIDYSKKNNINNGWGNPDDTADYTLKTIKNITKKYSGDEENIIITGFSRGAIACRFIGLRNNEIASVWKGIHECQHFDGDGWNGATKEGALNRLERLKGRPIFQTDNNNLELKKMLANEKVDYTTSGLGFHATTMFLDNRKSTLELRNWFRNIIK